MLRDRARGSRALTYSGAVPLSSPDRAVLAAVRRNPRISVTDLSLALDVPSAAVRESLDVLETAGFVSGRGFLVGARRPIVVIGGAVMDVKMQTAAPALIRTSNPGRASWTPGGVGRNIAENLARLGALVGLVAPIGADPPGIELADRTRQAGVGVDRLIRTTHATGIYCAVVDSSGELVIGVSDMEGTDQMTVRMLAPHQDLVSRAELVILDGNLPAPVTGWVLDFVAASRVPVVIDPVSVAKAAPLATTLAPRRPVHTITPNPDELAAIVGLPVPNETEAIVAAAAQAHDLGVAHVWVRRGPLGSLLSSREEGSAQSVVELAAPAATVIDVTGAGDSMTAGFVHAWLATGDVVEAARFGQALASLTVESIHTVRPDLSEDLVEARLARTDPARLRGAR